MKVHLMVAPTTFSLNYGDLGKGTDPPLGIMYLASYAQKFGPPIDFALTDGILEGFDKTLGIIKEISADIIGISAVTTNIIGAYKLIDFIRKELPETIIILGGPHPTAMPEEAFERSNPDIVVVGEGEKTFTELLEYYVRGDEVTNELKKIDGLYLYDGKKIVKTKPRDFIKDLDTIPFPARDLIAMEKYKGYPIFKANPSSGILSSRGCPFNCTFCSNNIWKSAKPYYRVRSPKNIADELEYLVSKGYREFFDFSDELNTNLEYSKEIFREIIRRDMNIFLKCQLRAKPIDEELVMLMKDAGVWYVHIGIESGNKETIIGIRKKVTHDDVEKCCILLKKHGIKIWGLFMYFNIWERDNTLHVEDYEKSLNTFHYAKRLYKDKLVDYFGGSICTPTPGSELWDIALRHKLIKEEYLGDWDKWFYKKDLRLISRVPGVSEKQIFKLHQKTFRYIALSLLFGKAIKFKNIGFVVHRSLYFLKRAILLKLSKN
ncbi:MAG: B12-binding domain-containing radical SAM protein [Desulfobacula sp.]|nr:B12-binding domain-containing radical SAM protein [Desulfobacula sp.]